MVLARHLFISAVVLGLTACATTTYTPAGRITYDQVNPDEGVVVVKVMNVKPVSMINRKWLALKLQNKETGSIETIADTAPLVANYSQFVGKLSPGQYEISNFDAGGIAPFAFGVLPALIIHAMTSDSQSLASQAATFTVKPGTVSNLGVIVTLPPESKEDQLRLAVLADEKAQAAAFEDVEAATRQRIAGLPMRSWDRMPDSTSLARATDIVREHTRLISTLGTSKDGKLLLGAPLGMINVRTGEGKWTTIPTGTLDWVTYVGALEDGRIAAGTDNGKIFVCSTEQATCQLGSINNPDAKITQIVPMDKWGYAIVTANSKGPVFGETRVYLKNNLAGMEPAGEIIKANGLGLQPTLFDGETLRVYEMEPGITRTSKVYQFNPATGEVKHSSVDFWANNLYRLADGTLVFNRMNGMSNYNDVSRDNGKTWVRNDVAAPIGTRMLDVNRGYGINNIATGWSTVTIALNRTTDGGKTWERVGTTIETSGPQPVYFSDGRVFVFTGKELLSTADEARTWKVEWPAVKEAVARAEGETMR